MGQNNSIGLLFRATCAVLVLATPAMAQQDRVSATEKGSLLIFSKVELRWTPTAGGQFDLQQDTFLDLANDFPGLVFVKMYFVNGDPPLEAVPGGERAHPGWNWVDNTIILTPNQPTYWSALSGEPAGVSPFTALDPGFPPGRPDPESMDRVLRGYVLAWAVLPTGEEIRWNHLKGDATIVNYGKLVDAGQPFAWEYNAYAFQVVSPTNNGEETDGMPGILALDGVEYAPCFDLLLLDFYAVGSTAFNPTFGLGMTTANISDTDLTLFPVTADLRQETLGPVTTKADFAIWNQNEIGFSGAFRCITCWDQTLLGDYGIPNHFLLANLQTDKGKARIDGVFSQVCDTFDDDGLPVLVSVDVPLLGVVAKMLTITSDGPMGTLVSRAAAGTNLAGMGTETAFIMFDVGDGGPPETDFPLPPSRFDSAPSRH